jgi:hypothetical protein
MSTNTRGQANRNNNMKEVKEHLARFCPDKPQHVINLVAGEMNMAPDTIRYSFLPILIAQEYVRYGEDGLLHYNTEKVDSSRNPASDTRSEDEQLQDMKPEEREAYERFKKSRKA